MAKYEVNITYARERKRSGRGQENFLKYGEGIHKDFVYTNLFNLSNSHWRVNYI